MNNLRLGSVLKYREVSTNFLCRVPTVIANLWLQSLSLMYPNYGRMIVVKEQRIITPALLLVRTGENFINEEYRLHWKGLPEVVADEVSLHAPIEIEVGQQWVKELVELGSAEFEPGKFDLLQGAEKVGPYITLKPQPILWWNVQMS